MQIVALDLETTGLDPKKDTIIEIALVKFDSKTFKIIDTFSTLINPLIPIPELITNICNITDDDVENAPILTEDLMIKIEDFIGDCPILGHNTNFDRDFLLNHEIDVSKNIVLDTFILANIINYEEKSLNLGFLCEKYDIILEGAHRALNDTEATVKLFEKQLNDFKALPSEKKALLSYIFSFTTDKSFEVYKELIGLEKNSLSEEDFTKIILDIVGPYQKEKDRIKYDFENISIENIFKNLGNSEYRENQLLMAKQVFESLNENKKTIIEAPTGVGKTFAYSIPSIIDSLKNETQVVISTHTKALQDQIYYKDLDFLLKNLGYEFTYTKLKGKANYISLHRFIRLLCNSSDLSANEISFFSKIILWLYKTDFGELDDLTFYGIEFSLLKEIHSDHFIVLNDENPAKKYEFLFKARNKATTSNIVVINHLLLMKDSSAKTPLFGKIKKLIIDESHNLEDTVTEGLKEKTDSEEIKNTLEKLQKTSNIYNYKLENFENLYQNITNNVSLIFDLLSFYGASKNQGQNPNYETLIENDFFEKNEGIGKVLNLVENSLIEILDFFGAAGEKLFLLIKNDLAIIENALHIFQTVLNKEKTDVIKVFTYNSKYSNELYYTVLNVGKFLEKTFWTKADSVILTSATLDLGDDFKYIKESLGIDENFSFLKLKTDFDYANQALVLIPNNLGTIKYNNPFINKFLLDFFETVKGNTLMLFTSYSAIKDTYLYCHNALKKLNIELLAQNIGGSKHKIISYFKKHSDSSIMFGTDSFWEGIDIPGNDLKYLIIHKFPFGVPTDPIFKARSRLYKDAFSDYSIPKAIIKTKQGFGRLIRTKTDKGIFILLDDRIINTSWGEKLKKSFPDEVNFKISNSQTFLELLKNKKS